MWNLSTYLSAIKAIGAVTAKLPEVEHLISAGAKLLHAKDQNTAREAYFDLIEDNSEGYSRLDKKLADAERK